MTETTEATAPATSATDMADTTAAGTESPGDAENGAQPSRAAGYRQRAQESEAAAQWLVAERDEQLTGLRQQVEQHQRGDVERIAGTHIRDGSDLWSTGATLDELLGDDGQVDTAKVAEVAQELAREKPHWRRPGATESSSSVRGNQRVGDGTGQPSFADAFKPK